MKARRSGGLALVGGAAVMGFLFPWVGGTVSLVSPGSWMVLVVSAAGAIALALSAWLVQGLLVGSRGRVESLEGVLGSVLELSGQGYLVCGPDGLVVLHSASCVSLLGQVPAGRPVSELLWTKPSQQQDSQAGFDLVFSGKAAPGVVFDLLDSQTELAGRVLRLQYRSLPGPRILVAITDLSLERREESRTQEEELRRSVLLKVVSQRTSFASLSQAASDLFDELGATELVPLDETAAETLARNLHTFKANAAFFEFRQTATAAHEFEQHLSDTRALGQKPDLRTYTLALKRAYFAEIHLVTDVLGEQWLVDADAVAVPKPLLLKLEAHLREKMPEDQTVVPLLRRFRTVPFRELFVRYPDLAAGLAERLGKALHPVLVEGGDFPVLPEKFSHLADVLTHLVRNQVDHGIELPHEREAAGKGPKGLIQIHISREAGGLFLVFSDDGRGINLEKVEARAREKGLLAPGEKATQEKLLDLLFVPGFSTADEVTELSGRGVGLDAVRREVLRLGGTLTVNTRPGKGTSFDILIPVKTKSARRTALQEV